MPANLNATTVAQTQSTPGAVNLSWDASTDNVGVSGYAIYRDGAQVGTVGTETTYADQTVQPETTYNYQVLATDAYGNQSALSTPALSVTTPSTGVLFSDGFESGDLSNWTSVTGSLSTETADVSTATMRPRGRRAAAKVATHRKTLPCTRRSSLYYRIRFKIEQPARFGVVRLPRTLPHRLGGTRCSASTSTSTGKLGLRNDVTRVITEQPDGRHTAAPGTRSRCT